MLGECRFGGPIDRDFGSMVCEPGKPPNWSGPKLFAYLRYDPDVTPAGLAALKLPDIDAQAMQEMEASATRLGADAIIAVDFDYEVIGKSGSMLMVCVCGTAVRLG